MNTIKFSLFDIFGYALPGFFVLCSIFLASNSSIQGIHTFLELMPDLGLSSWIFITILSFVLGFAIDTPGSWLYYKVGCNIFKYYKSEISEKYVISREEEKQIQLLIRQKSPENTGLIQTWKLYKTMSHNLSFSLLMISTSSLLKALFLTGNYGLEWLSLCAISVIISILILHRATIFDTWYYNEVIYTALALNLVNLKERSKFDKED